MILSCKFIAIQTDITYSIKQIIEMYIQYFPDINIETTPFIVNSGVVTKTKGIVNDLEKNPLLQDKIIHSLTSELFPDCIIKNKTSRYKQQLLNNCVEILKENPNAKTILNKVFNKPPLEITAENRYIPFLSTIIEYIDNALAKGEKTFRILDIGCAPQNPNNGAPALEKLVDLLQIKYGKSFEVEAVDIANIEQHIPYGRNGIRYTKADLFSFSPEKPYDIVLYIKVPIFDNPKQPEIHIKTRKILLDLLSDSGLLIYDSFLSDTVVFSEKNKSENPLAKVMRLDEDWLSLCMSLCIMNGTPMKEGQAFGTILRRLYYLDNSVVKEKIFRNSNFNYINNIADSLINLIGDLITEKSKEKVSIWIDQIKDKNYSMLYKLPNINIDVSSQKILDYKNKLERILDNVSRTYTGTFQEKFSFVYFRNVLKILNENSPTDLQKLVNTFLKHLCFNPSQFLRANLEQEIQGNTYLSDHIWTKIPDHWKNNERDIHSLPIEFIEIKIKGREISFCIRNILLGEKIYLKTLF